MFVSVQREAMSRVQLRRRGECQLVQEYAPSTQRPRGRGRWAGRAADAGAGRGRGFIRGGSPLKGMVLHVTCPRCHVTYVTCFVKHVTFHPPSHRAATSVLGA